MNSTCTVIKAHDTSRNPATEGDAKYKSHITLYGANEPPPEPLLPYFQRMEMFAEFERGFAPDPFDGDDTALEKSFHSICTSPGWIVLHSTRLQVYQFRTFAFSVGVFGDVARLFR